MLLRRTPDDFRVDEHLADAARALITPEPSTAHRFAVYLLRKTSLTTPEACQRLARALATALGGKPPDVSYAGLKDRHAVTSQHVTAALAPGREAPPAPHDAPAQRPARDPGGEPPWSATLLGYAPAAAEASWIARNDFAITIRSLAHADIRAMNARAEFLALPDGASDAADPRGPSLLIVNYFGAQRFASARHAPDDPDAFAARRLIAGHFDGALRLLIGTPVRKDTGARRALTRALAAHWGDWTAALAQTPPSPQRRALEALAAGGSARDAFAALPFLDQQMAVEAYQSFLWNQVARELVQTAAPADTLRAEDDAGVLAFPRPASVPPDLLRLQLPQPAHDAAVPQPAAAAYSKVLASHGLTLDALRIPGLRRPAFGAAERPLFVRATGVSLSPPSRDALAPARSSKPFSRLATFSLPRGAYATVLLRALGGTGVE
jgi:tRNA pseudouridine13 synthase